jgi:hypothetical protein
MWKEGGRESGSGDKGGGGRNKVVLKWIGFPRRKGREEREREEKKGRTNK